VVAAALLCLVLMPIGPSRWTKALLAFLAVEAVWRWLAFRWIDRYGARSRTVPRPRFPWQSRTPL
jgi:hypothetical protein